MFTDVMSNTVETLQANCVDRCRDVYDEYMATALLQTVYRPQGIVWPVLQVSYFTHYCYQYSYNLLIFVRVMT